MYVPCGPMYQMAYVFHSPGGLHTRAAYLHGHAYLTGAAQVAYVHIASIPYECIASLPYKHIASLPYEHIACLPYQTHSLRKKPNLHSTWPLKNKHVRSTGPTASL